MKNIIKVVLVSAAMAVPAFISAGGSSKTQTVVTNCTGTKSTCTARIGAIGEVRFFDISAYQGKITALGKITSKQNVTVNLPQNPNEATVYSFTPSSGELAGDLIYVIFENVPQAPGTATANKTVIIVSRMLQEEVASKKETEAGRIITTATLNPVTVSFDVDGTATWIDSTGTPQVYTLGKRQLGPPAA